MALPERELTNLDFRYTKSTWIRFAKHGSRRLPQGIATEFEWKDYCPMVFRHLQELDKIDYADYRLSICDHDTLWELSSPGKRHCLFYSSVLLDMLPNYYDHVLAYPNTLLTKFYGLHLVRPAGGYKVYFVVMGNILHSDLCIHRRFDLKGSSQGRSVSKGAVDQSTTFKDLDLNLVFQLGPLIREQFLMQIKHDCEFFEAVGIMDYSLLLGLHIESPIQGSGDSQSGISFPPDSSWASEHYELPFVNNLKESHWTELKLGVKTPARAIPMFRNGSGSESSDERGGSRKCFNVKLYFGIIDFLQGYNVKKRIEHMYKSIQFDARSISAVNPKMYSTRFQDFLRKVFPAADDLDSSVLYS